VAALRKAGACVQHLHVIGQGCPDLAVGIAGRVYFLEVKREGERMNAEQLEWASRWRGHFALVYTADDALRAVGLRANRKGKANG